MQILDIKKNVDKEISEAMTVHKYVKKIVLAHPERNYIHIDFCSGNAFVPVLSAFTLPVQYSVAIDKKERIRNWDSILKFKYLNINIFEKTFLGNLKLLVDLIGLPFCSVIFTGVHACGNLTTRIIDIFNDWPSKEKHLILMPCCIGNLEETEFPTLMDEKLGRDLLWAWQNYQQIKAKEKNILQDEKCLSPRNFILTAKEIR